MNKLKTLAALIALALTHAAHAADTPVTLQAEYKAQRGATVTTMPAGVTLVAAQDRLREFLLARDSEIVRDVAGEIEARTPFGIAQSDNGLIVGHIQATMTADNGHVWYKRRVMRLSQETGGPVLIQWCHKALEKNVAGARVPERIGCKATFAEWQLLREITAQLVNGGIASQGVAAEVRP